MTRRAPFGSAVLVDDDQRGLRVWLRCLDCGLLGSFQFDRAFVDIRSDEVDPDWDGVCFSRPAKCAGCGVVDRYELVRPSAQALHVQAASVGSERALLSSSEPVVRARMQAWDGTVARRPSGAIAHLRGQVEARPDSAEAWRRFGNCCAQFGLYDESERALRNALDVDAGELHAAIELAALLWFLGREDTALAVQQALQRLGETQSRQFDRREPVERLVRVMKDLAYASHDDVSLEIIWADAPVGNDVAVHLSKIDIQKIDRWDRLVDMLASGDVIAARIVPGIPPDEPTQLQTLLDSSAKYADPGVLCMRSAQSRERPVIAPVWRSSSKKRNRRKKANSRSR